MARLFYPHEVIHFIIIKKQNNHSYYQTVNKQVVDSKTKATLRKLIQEEKKREHLYTQMLSELNVRQTPGVQESDEYHAYVEHLIESSTNVSPTNLMSDKNAIQHVIDIATDSMQFYTKLKNFIPNEFSPFIDEVILTETKFLSALLQL